MGTGRTQATLAYAGEVSSQFEPTAAEGDSVRIKHKIRKATTAVVGSVCNMLPVTGLSEVHCCSVAEA